MYGTAEDFENTSTEQLAIFERLLETAKAHHDAAPIKADAEKASGGPVHDPRLTSSLPRIPRRVTISNAHPGVSENGQPLQQRQPLYSSLTGALGGFQVELAGVPLHAAAGSYVQGIIGNRPAAVQGQIERLKINPSFKAYAENNPVQSKIFEEVLSIRGCLTIAHFKYTELFEGISAETFYNDFPSYFAQALEHANCLDHAIKLADETFNSLSEQLMYTCLSKSFQFPFRTIDVYLP
jgi:hypothetical protein